MNKKQKITLYAVLAVIVVSVAVWGFYGWEIFTKTRVMVESQTELEQQLGISRTEWEDKFIWGLDYTLIVSAAAIIIGSFLLFIFRNKQNTYIEEKQ